MATCSSAVSTGAVLEVLEPPCITSADQLGHPRLATDPKPQKDVGPYNRESVTCATSKKVLPARPPAQKEITYSSSGSETSLSVTPTLTRSPGINNALICFVRTSFSRADPSAVDTGVPKQEAHQEHVLTGNATSNTSANRCLPKLEGFVRRELRTPESLTQGRAHVPEMTQNTPSFEKSLCPFINLHYSPHIHNVNSDQSYLDRERKVLGKLSKILQTDSLTKIQKWFATASEKEKDDIFRLIYSEPNDEGMLNSKEGTAETMRSPSLQKPLSPLQRSPEGIRSQSSKGETVSFALNIEKQRSSASSPTAPREELQLRKRYGNKRPCCFTVCRSLTCATATPDNTNPLSLEPPVQSH
ncbi:C4orf17 [Columba livia]|nr:C4orf17 [Columba livia]